MRIVALSDIHRAYSKMVALVSSERSFDVIIVAGDLTTRGSRREAEEAIKQLQAFGKPVLAVAGNMDPPELDDLYEDLGISLNARGTVIDGVGFFGVSAAPLSPLKTPYEISEEEIARRCDSGWKDIMHARWKVFVPHSPPANTKLDVIRSGLNVGSHALREFIEIRRPDVVICGHIHEARGTDVIGTSQIMNCGSAGEGFYGRVTISDAVHLNLLP